MMFTSLRRPPEIACENPGSSLWPEADDTRRFLGVSSPWRKAAFDGSTVEDRRFLVFFGRRGRRPLLTPRTAGQRISEPLQHIGSTV